MRMKICKVRKKNFLGLSEKCIRHKIAVRRERVLECDFSVMNESPKNEVSQATNCNV
jgi:hypothetical protein